MPPPSAPEVVYRLTCELPVQVRVGSVLWTISLSYGHKGRFAEIVASGGCRSGVLAQGRTRHVESLPLRGISVPLGTVRHRIMVELERAGRAVAVRG